MLDHTLVFTHVHASVCAKCYLWLGSMVVRGASGCKAAEPVAWLEKRRCDITLGRKASCSLTTLGMLIESSKERRMEDSESSSDFYKCKCEVKGIFLTLFIILISAAECVLGGLTRWLAVLLPNCASASVGARHCG